MGASRHCYQHVVIEERGPSPPVTLVENGDSTVVNLPALTINVKDDRCDGTGGSSSKRGSEFRRGGMDDCNCCDDPDERLGGALPLSQGIGFMLGGRALVGP